MRSIIIPFLFTSFLSLGQTDFKIFYNDFVECFYDNNSIDSLIVYDNFKGKKIKTFKIDSTRKRSQWIKIAVRKTHYDWSQIESIMFAPQMDSNNIALLAYKGHWIKTQHLLIQTPEISLPDSSGIPFYSLPSTQSKIIHKTRKFVLCTLIKTKGLWANVSFTHKEQLLNAWIERKHLCATPWTSCILLPE